MTLGVFAAFVLLTGMVTSPGFVFAQNTDSDKSAKQPNRDCQDAADARKQIAILDKKYDELKQRAYDEWERQSKSGQYSGTWDDYAQKFLDSQEVKEIQTMRQKYAETEQKCSQANPSYSKPESTDPAKRICASTDYENIKKNFFAIEQKYVAAKERYYKEWEEQSKSGAYAGAWEQYAKEKFHSSLEAAEYRKAQEKYNDIILYCQSSSVLQKPNKIIQRPAVCNESEFDAARKTISQSEYRVVALKEKLYSEWKRQYDAGNIRDEWGIYMKRHFDGSDEVKEWKRLQEKYANVIHICTPTNVDVVRPDNPTLKQSDVKTVKPNKISTEKKTKESDKYDKLTKAKKIKKSKKTAPIIVNKSGRLIQE